MTETEKQIEFADSDFLRIEENPFGKRFDIIVSNPPYISESAFKTLAADIKEFEPIDALGDGADGLTFFKKISDNAQVLLKPGGWVFVETSFNQAKNVEKIFREAAGRKDIQIRKDLSNIERVVSARF